MSAILHRWGMQDGQEINEAIRFPSFTEADSAGKTWCELQRDLLKDTEIPYGYYAVALDDEPATELTAPVVTGPVLTAETMNEFIRQYMEDHKDDPIKPIDTK